MTDKKNNDKKSFDLQDLYDELDNVQISAVSAPGELRRVDEADELSPCYDCGKIHLPRRIVCCVDGTWMSADGATGSSKITVAKL